MKLRFEQESDFRQERDFGQKITATFEFIGVHWRALGRVLLMLVLPAALVQHVLSVLVQRQLYVPMMAATKGLNQTGFDGLLGLQRNMWNSMASSPFYWLNIFISTAFATLLVLSIYGYVLVLLGRRAPGPTVTVAEVWAVVRRSFIGTYFSIWGLTIVLSVGFLCLLLPGFYLSVALSLFFIVQLTEGTGFGGTISRCLLLIRGKWWSTFGLIFILTFILNIIATGVTAAIAMLPGGLASVIEYSAGSAPAVAFINAIGGLLTLLLYPPLLLVLAFQYFNLVERKDGTGLSRLIDTLGQTAALQVSNSTYQPDDEGEY